MKIQLNKLKILFLMVVLVAACGTGDKEGMTVLVKLVKNFDLSNVTSGTLLFQQNGEEKYRLEFDRAALDGPLAMTDVVAGTYDVSVTLKDAAGIVLYGGTSTVIISAKGEQSITITLVRSIGALQLQLSWTEQKAVVAVRGDLALLQSGTIRYAKSLDIKDDNLTAEAFIDMIVPGSYEVMATIYDDAGDKRFETASDARVDIVQGDNRFSFSLDYIDKNSVSIVLDGDLAAPVIIEGPSLSVEEQDYSVNWLTDEPVMAEVAVSRNDGFDYTTTTTSYPLGGDSLADTTSQKIEISVDDLVGEYYYIAVSTDENGNRTLSDQKRFIPGEVTLTSYCTRCHTTDRIYAASKDATTWSSTIERMKSKGSTLNDLGPVDKQAIIDYLLGR